MCCIHTVSRYAGNSIQAILSCVPATVCMLSCVHAMPAIVCMQATLSFCPCHTMCVCRRYYRCYPPHIIYPTSYYIPYLILYTLPHIIYPTCLCLSIFRVFFSYCTQIASLRYCILNLLQKSALQRRRWAQKLICDEISSQVGTDADLPRDFFADGHKHQPATRSRRMCACVPTCDAAGLIFGK